MCFQTASVKGHFSEFLISNILVTSLSIIWALSPRRPFRCFLHRFETHCDLHRLFDLLLPFRILGSFSIAVRARWILYEASFSDRSISLRFEVHIVLAHISFMSLWFYLYIGITLSVYNILQGLGLCKMEFCIKYTSLSCV